MQDTLHPDRLVVGVRSERAEKLLREVYATPIEEGSPFVVTDFPTAELVKTSANSFLATKISFINAMAELCEATGGDVAKLAEAIGYDDRIGRKFLRAAASASAAGVCRRTSGRSWRAPVSWARTRR